MKTKLLAGAIALAALPTVGISVAHAQRAPAAVVVVVDTSRVGRECTACVSATAALQAQAQAFQQRRQALSAPLQTETQALQNEVQRVQAMPAGAARTAAENALRTRAQAFETNRQNAENELRQLETNLQSTQQNVSNQLNQRLQPIFAQVAASRGATLVVSTDATLYHAAATNVTNDVLQLLNQQVQAFSIVPLPQQQTPAQPQQPRPQGR